MPSAPLELFCFSITLKVVLLNKKRSKKCGNYGLLFEVFPYATASPIFSVEFKHRTSKECVDLFIFSLPITATLTIVVVENIELDPSNNPAREGLRLPTHGPLTKKLPTPVLLYYVLYQGWRTFLSGGSNLRSQTEKRKNVGHGCHNINEDLKRKFCRNLCKEQKKRSSPQKYPASHLQCPQVFGLSVQNEHRPWELCTVCQLSRP